MFYLRGSQTSSTHSHHAGNINGQFGLTIYRKMGGDRESKPYFKKTSVESIALKHIRYHMQNR